MAIVLIMFGAGLLFNLFSDSNHFYEIIMQWWPLLPIILGIEILAAGILAGSKKFNIKYDFVSMFLVLAYSGFMLAYLLIVELSVMNY
jgi:hypothetical protein